MKTVSMKPIVQKPRKDGFWAVYIRFTFDGRCQFWKTSKVVSSQNVKSKSEITDPHVLSFCSSLFLQWMEKLNHVDYSAWNLREIVEYVTNDDSHISFHEMYATEDSSCANVNSGIRQICQKIMGLSKEEDYSILTFRHTWATIAFNELGLDWQAVAFAMNHGSAHRVTQTYVKKDFSPAWELNEKVVEFIFFSDNPGKEELRREEKKLETDRISKNNLLQGTAFYKGKVVAEEEKTGFTNKCQLVALLVKRLPKDISTGAIVQFVIENIDKDAKWMYEHQKGKGFY